MIDKKKNEKYINLEDERAKKTIFGTTEKSNFILNMRIESVDKWLFGIISLAVILSAFGSLLTEFFKEINELPMMCFAIAGVMALVFALVVYQRRLYPKTVLAPTVIYGLMFLLAVVTAFYGEDVMQMLKDFADYFLYRDASFSVNPLGIALKGFPGRGEGVFTLFCYICFFLIAVRLSNSKKYTQKLFDVFVAVGLFQCFVGILQIIPPVSRFFEFYYHELFHSILTINVFLPNGTSASPIIFANFLAILTPITIIGGAKTENKKRKIFYTAATFFFVFFMIKTTTLIGIIGAILSLGVAIFFQRNLKNFLCICSAILIGAMFCFLAPKMYNTVNFDYEQPLQLYDTGIMWEDSSARIEASGFFRPQRIGLENDSVFKTYGYMWKETAKLAVKSTENFLLGVGEEKLALAQKNLENESQITQKFNSFDKPYNDLLYILATRGIFAVILYILFLVFAFKNATISTWQKKICVISCGIYLILSLISFSAIETTPIFFVLLGLSWKSGASSAGGTDGAAETDDAEVLLAESTSLSDGETADNL